MENLYFSNNNIKNIPVEIQKLKKLEIIYFYKNDINHIPYINLTGDEGNISFFFNPVTSIDPTFCKDFKEGIINPTGRGKKADLNIKIVNEHCRWN